MRRSIDFLDITLTDYANFLRVRGRFRDIQFEESSLFATPLHPDLPRVTAAIRGGGQIVVEIQGEDPDFLQRETIKFFELNKMNLESLTTMYTLEEGTEVLIKGLGEQSDTVREYLFSELEEKGDNIKSTTVATLFIPIPTEEKEEVPVIRARRARVRAASRSMVPTEIQRMERRVTQLRAPSPAKAQATPAFRAPEQISPPTYRAPAPKPEEEFFPGLQDVERRVIRAINARPNRKAQSNLLVKPTGLDQDSLRTVLRDLVEKGVLGVSSGWYVLKKPAVDALKGTPQEPVVTAPKREITTEKRKSLKLTPEENKVLKAIEARSNKKAQTHLLTRPTKMGKDAIKKVLRSLVEKGVLRVKYGWYTIVNN